jgi:hypothetical protein
MKVKKRGKLRDLRVKSQFFKIGEWANGKGWNTIRSKVHCKL